MHKLTVPPPIRQLAMFLTGGLLVSGVLLGSGVKALQRPATPPLPVSYTYHSSFMKAFDKYKPTLLGLPLPPKALVVAEVASTNNARSRPPLVKYSVKAGDTLGAIADQFGTTVDSVLSANPGVLETELQIGQSLDVPTFKGIIYAVQAGDTISEISQLYGIVPEDIASANNMSDPSQIRIGQKLVLPGATMRRQVASVARGGGEASRRSASFIWPLRGIITSEFGPRWGSFHAGIDIAADTGAVIVAAKPGVVEFSGWDGGYGNCVIVNHGDGTKTRYAHGSAILVDKGQSVDQGTPVMRAGSTGHSTGPHLHFEIMVNGTTRNPMSYLP